VISSSQSVKPDWRGAFIGAHFTSAAYGKRGASDDRQPAPDERRGGPSHYGEFEQASRVPSAATVSTRGRPV
jgi:hypothetical protein